MRIVLSRIEIHVDVLRFAVPNSCEATDRKKERERFPTTKDCVRLRSSALPWRAREKERQRKQGDAQSSFHQRSIAIAI